jgi:hypothetical protein
MTLAQQLKQEDLQQDREEGREEGIQLNAITIAKKLIAKGRSIHIQDLTVLNLVELEKA